MIANISGSKYNRLTAISPTNNRTKDGSILWIFECECGNKKEMVVQKVRSGSTKSCGCLRSEAGRRTILSAVKNRTLASGEASFNALYQSYKKGAIKRGLVFHLTKSHFRKLSQGKCHYCNSYPRQISHRTHHNGTFVYNGIDRKDNNLGYFIDNCVTCCKTCNRAKFDLTEDQFLGWIKVVYKHNF